MFILLLCLVALILLACSPPPELRNEAFLDDMSLISGEPCEAPCWQNLIPGETVWGVAQDFVKNSADFRIIEEVTPGLRNPEARIDFAVNDGPQCCRVLSRDGETLSVIVLLLAPHIELGDVVERYGDASHLTADSVSADQSTVALIYPDIPMVIYVFAENLDEAEISATSTVIGLAYLSESEMDTIEQHENLYNWEGYGRLGSIVDGTFDITAQPPAEE